jgi:hypothetical protein
MCLSYFYRYLTANRYGFFCPISLAGAAIDNLKTLTVLGFRFPYINGNKIPPNTYSTWSDNTGIYQSHRNHNTLLPGSMSFGSVNKLVSPKIKKSYKNMRLGWKFTTTNDIPSNGQVIIEFATSIDFTPKTTARCELKAN